MIGREQGADIHLQDALVSRRHAEIRWQEGDGWLLLDLGSRNGCLVNGEKVDQQQVLKDQDRLQFSGHVYQYHMVPPGSDLGLISSSGPQIDNDVTMGPGVNASDMATMGAAFSGKLTDGLLDLLQFLLMTRKTGRLDLLQGAALVGSIHVDSGTILHAQHPNDAGFDGLLALAQSTVDHFAFHSNVDAVETPSIDLPGDACLMELARQMDEG